MSNGRKNSHPWTGKRSGWLVFDLAQSPRQFHAQHGWSGLERGRFEAYCSKIKTAGFASLNESTTNFDGDTTYITPLPAMLPAMVPLPFVGKDEMENVALAVTPKLAPLGAPMSSVPVRLPVGLAPSPVNSPEKIVTPSAAVAVTEPAYLPVIALLVNGPASCASPNPNKTELSGTMKNA